VIKRCGSRARSSASRNSLSASSSPRHREAVEVTCLTIDQTPHQQTTASGESEPPGASGSPMTISAMRATLRCVASGSSRGPSSKCRSARFVGLSVIERDQVI
jgi:hypothetical protein